MDAKKNKDMPKLNEEKLKKDAEKLNKEASVVSKDASKIEAQNKEKELQKKNKEIIKKIKEEIIEKINADFEEKEVDQRLLYVVPYKEFNLTVPEEDNEVGLMLNDIFLAVREIKAEDGDINRFFDLYDNEGAKIGDTNRNHRLNVDVKLLEKILEEQIKTIENSGMKVAAKESLENEGRLETYLEMIGRELVVLNGDQEQDYLDALNKGKGNEYLVKASKEQTGVKENKKVDEQEEDEQAKRRMEKDLGVKISKSTRVNDELFYRNNPDIKARYVYAVLTDKNELQIVAMKDGKYQPVEGFEKSSAEVGRTMIARNDDEKMKTKNTYGAIYSSKHKNLRYTLSYGQYGEIDLIEQIDISKSGHLEDSEKYMSREVRTQNTDYLHVNREGLATRKNITNSTFDQSSSNRDAVAARNGSNGDEVDKREAIKRHVSGHEEDLTMEDMAQSPEQRLNAVCEKIGEKFEEMNIKLSEKDHERIYKFAEKQIENKDAVLCDEDIEKFCKAYVRKKSESGENIEKQGEEKTLEKDALRNREYRRHT